MRDYEDKINGLQIWERKVSFEDTYTCVFHIYYEPANFFWKIMDKLRLISPEIPIVEIENDFMCWEYLEIRKQDRLRSKIIFKPKSQGTKTLRFAALKDTANRYKIRIVFDRLYN
jgi:hypothetical protein